MILIIKDRRQSIIEFVTGALLLDFGVECNHNEEPDLIEECRSDIIRMREYARMHKLDTKQRIAFVFLFVAFLCLIVFKEYHCVMI